MANDRNIFSLKTIRRINVVGGATSAAVRSDHQRRNGLVNRAESSTARASPTEGYRAGNQTPHNDEYRGTGSMTAGLAPVPRGQRRANTALPEERGQSSRDWNTGGSNIHRRGEGGRGQSADGRIGSRSQEPFVTPEHAGNPENIRVNVTEVHYSGTPSECGAILHRKYILPCPVSKVPKSLVLMDKPR